ncbi:MAG: hypothetical protein V4654_00265 [Bdellovibrionota bacterium]
MNKFTSIIFIILFATVSHAVEMGVPIQLKLKDPAGVYPDASNVNFTVRILTPNNGCVLREETFSNQTVVSGTVSLALGTGSRSGDDPNLTLTQVYDNSTAKNGLDCVDINNNPGLLNQTYNPAATDKRVIRVSTAGLGASIIVDFIQRATPYAIHAESVGGKVADDILVQNGATSLNQSNLEDIFGNATKFNKLKNIADNGIADNAVTATTATNATNFIGVLVGDVTGTMSATVVGKIQGVTVSATAPRNGQVLVYNGSQYVPTTMSSGSGGGITSATAILGDVTGSVSATVVSSVGGKSAAAVATAVTDVNSATTMPTASTIAKRDTSGSLIAANLLSTNNSTQNVYIFEGTNTNSVRLKAPNSFADYILVLPTTDGSNGEVLQTDGNGNLSWIPGALSATSATIISALGYTPADGALVVLKSNNLGDLVSATVARTNLGLSAAAIMTVGTLAGTLAAGDDARITGALSQTSFNTYVAGATCTTGQTMYWNSVSSLFDCQNIAVSGDISGIVSNATVTKVQGVGVSITAIANNHLLQYNGTNLVNRAIPTCSANQYLTFNGTAWACATDLGSAGILTNVSSTNAYITVATSSTTPALTLNVGTSAGTVAAGNDSRIANALQTTTTFVGDVSGTYNTMVLNPSGVNAGTYTKMIVNAKGIVTSGATLIASDIPSLDVAKITTGQLPITLGGTGAATSATALSNIGAARRGANDDITSFVNSLIFSSSANIYGNFAVSGTSLLVGNVSMSASASVAGNLTVAGDATVTGVMNGIAKNAAIQNSPTTAGTTTAYTVSYGTAADAKITTNSTGDTVRFKVNAINTGAATLKVAGAPAANIFSAFTGAALGSGDLQIGYVDATFDGTNWVANIPPRRVTVAGLNLTNDVVQTLAATGVRAGDGVSCSLTQTGTLSTTSNWVYSVMPTTDAIRVVLDENNTAGPVTGITCIILK